MYKSLQCCKPCSTQCTPYLWIRRQLNLSQWSWQAIFYLLGWKVGKLRSNTDLALTEIIDQCKILICEKYQLLKQRWCGPYSRKIQVSQRCVTNRVLGSLALHLSLTSAEQWIGRRFLLPEALLKLTSRNHTFLHLLLYHCSLLAGLPSTTVKPLQRVQNAAVRLVLTLVFVIMRHLDYNSSTVEHRIIFKLCMLMHPINIGCAPRYMADSVQSLVESSRRPGLRSADTADYVKHRLQSKFGERCFSYAAWSGSLELTTSQHQAHHGH